MKRKKIENEVNNNEEENKLKELWSDPKGQAGVKLGLWLIFILAVIVYARIANNSSSAVKDNNTNNIKSEINKVEESVNNNKSKISLSGIKKGNYSFVNEIILTKNNVENKYYYNGKKTKDKMLFNKIYNETPVLYKMDDNLYYKNENDIYNLTTKEEIYDVVKEEDINMDNIIKLIEKGQEEYTTTHNDGKILISYKTYLKDIIENNNSEDYVSIVLTRDDDTYTFEIDYTNLIKLTDSSITKYNLKTIINDVGEIEDEDIK